MSKVLDQGLAVSRIPNEVVEVAAHVAPIISNIESLTTTERTRLIRHHVRHIAPHAPLCTRSTAASAHILLDQPRQILVVHDDLGDVVVEFGELALALVEVAAELHGGVEGVLVLAGIYVVLPHLLAPPKLHLTIHIILQARHPLIVFVFDDWALFFRAAEMGVVVVDLDGARSIVIEVRYLWLVCVGVERELFDLV